MRSIRLKNVRSLADTGEIEIRPITLLLGMNSSGKSTLLRTFPLIMQSIRTPSNAPVLWYGDYVDFGSVQEVKSSFAEEENVVIQLDLGRTRIVRSRLYYGLSNVSNIFDRLAIKIELEDADDKTRLGALGVDMDGDSVEVKIGTKNNITSINVNGYEYSRFFPSEKFRVKTTEFVPQIFNPTAIGGARSPYRRKGFDVIDLQIVQFLKGYLHGKVSDETLSSIAAKLYYASVPAFTEQLHGLVSTPKSWQKFVAEVTLPENLEKFEELRRLYLLSGLSEILFQVERNVSAAFLSLSYVGPSRATGERYYRMQELAVDQIDPQGKNLAMFLNSLSNSQQAGFSRWLMESIGYGINIEKQTGHIQIELREEHSSKSHNLADMGYGFSQVLPIMAQIWSRQSRGRTGTSSPFVVMEQPELHLHPAYQAKLADVFAKAITRIDEEGDRVSTNIKFIIETHSEAIVNRLGDLIFEGIVDANDVGVYVFDKDEEDDRKTRITSSEFQDDGSLNNWPVGFFSSRVM